jgi:hypothetical protein
MDCYFRFSTPSFLRFAADHHSEERKTGTISSIFTYRYITSVVTMAKTRVATRLKDAVGGKKSHNQSQDLVQLTEKYNVFVKRLQGLIIAVKSHFAAMQTIAKSRYTVRRRNCTARRKIEAGSRLACDLRLRRRASRFLLLLYATIAASKYTLHLHTLSLSLSCSSSLLGGSTSGSAVTRFSLV